MTNEIRVRDGDDEETGLEFQRFFPEFMWVLRDFALDFKHLTPQSYIHQCLELNNKLGDDNAFRQNSIKKAITNFFSSIDCAALVRPVHDEK